MWPNRRIQSLFGIEHPILLAPMAGSAAAALAVAVAEAGGLGALPTATLTPEQMRGQLEIIRQLTSKPINVNVFVHTPPTPDAARETNWRRRLSAHYATLGLDPDGRYPTAGRNPFNDEYCAILEPFRPEVVSFHFGMPEPALVKRAKAWGAKIISSATTVTEARYLEDHGCDAIIAQGAEAGGHRGIFLSDDIIADVSRQPGTMALVPQIVDAVAVPVIAAGGIADGRGIAAAFMLGASAVQIGTAYLFCPEALTTPLHRAALKSAGDDATTLTNVFTGRPARGIVNAVMREIGPLNREVAAFPLAGHTMAPLRAAAEARGSSDYSPLWSGQSARLGREMPAAELTRTLVREALTKLGPTV